ncbi:hypothetical protein BDZ91DRAFT_801182 [Kalaharituber pfeilii]|nr:hypothetical protein BDZ91DRAFT_801182 [Kalaharituber pfeilii]
MPSELVKPSVQIFNKNWNITSSFHSTASTNILNEASLDFYELLNRRYTKKYPTIVIPKIQAAELAIFPLDDLSLASIALRALPNSCKRVEYRNRAAENPGNEVHQDEIDDIEKIKDDVHRAIHVSEEIMYSKAAASILRYPIMHLTRVLYLKLASSSVASQ